eukprot:m.21557 g.21557  ORF g.21557 m.21557 type:complete len:62 (-) comp6462_c0_seq1:372-557(-)
MCAPRRDLTITLQLQAGANVSENDNCGENAAPQAAASWLYMWAGARRHPTSMKRTSLASQH